MFTKVLDSVTSKKKGSTKPFPISILSSFHNSHLGIEYTLGRIPMASCDFSTHPYSYDDNNGDFNLTKFSLTQEDKKFKVAKSLWYWSFSV